MPPLTVRILALAALLLLALTACDGDNGADSTATPTPIPTGELGLSRTVVPPPVGLSPGPVPDAWQTYASDTPIAYSFRYPDGWYTGGEPGNVQSWNQATWSDPGFPANGMSFEVVVTEPGAPGQPLERPTEASDTAVDGLQAWEIVYAFDPPTPVDGLTRQHIISLEHEGQQVTLVAYFAQDEPDELTYRQIVDSFQFLE